MVSISDAINKNGHTKVKVEWTLSARKIDDQTTEYTNHIHASATDEFMAFIQEHGITLEQAAAARQIASDAHNREETPQTSLSASNAMRVSEAGGLSLSTSDRFRWGFLLRNGAWSRRPPRARTDPAGCRGRDIRYENLDRPGQL